MMFNDLPAAIAQSSTTSNACGRFSVEIDCCLYLGDSQLKIDRSRVPLNSYDFETSVTSSAKEVERVRMPFYDCMLLLKPHVKKEVLADLVARVGKHAYSRNDVLTDIKSLGTVQLGMVLRSLMEAVIKAN
ncbi:hypothetical protein K2173_017867 [Erythroxylum novogranatense]|uniref:Uncharacterized protein n=1 Tax=Erythroxylum novogranatense TaxID=1862640 RepID=A0AAV8SLV6_9ROSI|nr:hypothetical protein K2173_017867 [Erythroxylum novogranatense]